jgi:hypothetical protein
MPITPFCNITLTKYSELIVTALSAVIETLNPNQYEASKTGMSGIYLIHAYLVINTLIIALLGYFAGFLLTLTKASNLFDAVLIIFMFGFSIILIKTYSWNAIPFLDNKAEENEDEKNIIPSRFYRWYIVDDIFGSTLIQVLPFSAGIVFATYLNL